MALDGKNISLPIYHDVNGVRTPFHNLVLHKFTVDSVVMSLGDKITGDVYYIDSNLDCSMKEYVVFNDVEYTLVNPPTLVREGLVKDNSDLKGMSKFSFEFYHPMYILGNLPFTDVAVSYDEMRYKSQDKTFSWIGKPADFVAKLNKNLENTEWVVVLSDRFPQDKEDELSEVLSFDNNTIADVLKTGYETWEVPFVVDKLHQGEYYFTDANHNNVDYYSQNGGNKRFVVVFGLPSNEIYASATDEQQNIPFVFRFGQGVGLKNNSRTPRNNKIVTRIAGYGSENNIPYGYPQIRWYGDPNATCTIGDSVGAKQNVTINGTTYEWAMSYPIYDGIVGGEWVKLIKHPFTRNHLMPTIYVGKPYNENDDESDAIYYGGVFNKVSQFLPDGSANPNYNPDIEIKDYYDAVEGEQGYDYKNLINPVAPSYEIHEFDDIKPELGEAYILGATPVNADLTDADDWDDTMDDNGNYLQSYFKITLPQLTFDIYACAAITQEMEINMRSGACIGCTFTVQVDWEDYKRNFYDSDMNFAPNGQQRDYTRYPDSSQGSITVVVQKDINTFGTLMPNIYQHPKGQIVENGEITYAGDAFVVLGISLPLSYITSAQERLDDAMKSYMLGNNVYYFDYPLKFDEYMLANNTNILNQIRPNSIIRFEFNDEPLELFVKQLTIKFNENTLPQYDITLTDNIEVVLNQIGQVAEDVEHLGTLIALLRQNYNKNAWVELAKKLSKVSDDTASGLISFAQGWETVGFFSNNFLGYGAKVNQRGVGEFEEINIRGALRAAELIFNQILASGGEEIKSVGYGEIETVSPVGSIIGTATLKLDGDEWPTIKVGDICRGLYNTIGKDYDNSSNEYDSEDNNGFRNKKGFFSSYFRIEQIYREDKGVCRFKYQLQTENGVAVTEHPCPLMKFAVYGNNNDANKDRQSSIYTTAIGIAPRVLYLAGVNDWKIKPENIKIANGNIDGLKVWEEISEEQAQQYGEDDIVETYIGTDGETHYKHLMTLVGNAGFYCENNIYLGGIIEQIRSIAASEVSAQVSHIGEAWIKSNPSDRYTVDCYEDGTAMDSHQFTITVNLYFGSEICNLDGLNCLVDDGVVSGHPTVSLDNKAAFYDVSIEQGENINTRMITFTLSGSLNGETYNMVKTIAIVANRQGITGSQGEQGDDGIGAVYIETNEEYFVVPCNSQGKALERVDLYVEASLKVGDEDATLKQSGGQCNINYNGHSYFFLFNGNLAYKTLTVSAGTTPADTLTITLKGTYEGTEYTKTKKIHVIAQKQGESGIKGSFKSTAFKRTNTDIKNTTPIGGDYDDPKPTGWYDGIPDGEETLWATTCTFNGDGTDSGWSNPRKMTDTATYDVEFSPNEICPDDPSDVISERQEQGWYDPDTTLPDGLTWGQMIWRAERECKNGDWGQWIKLKIKGENGEGVGIASITTYYLRTIKYQGVTVSDFGTQTNYLLPTAELPYLWRYTHVLYTDNSSYNSNPELIYTYSDRPNINLLDDTSFLDLDNMDAWTEKGLLAKNASTPLEYQVSATNGEFYVRYKGNGSAGEAGYINYLVQPIANKLSPSSWYTFSFEVYGGHLPPNVYSTKDYYLDLNMTGLFDSSVSRFIDGVASSSSNIVVHFTPTTSWTRHTVTFKTPSTIGDDVTAKWQMYTRKTDDYIILRKPKLESGMVATEYISGSTSRQPMARTTRWAAGTAYFKGATGERFIDIVSLEGKWYQCLKSHTSADGNKPQVGTQTTYWMPANNFGFIATDLLLADTGVINLLFGNTIYMRNKDSELTASINEDGRGGYIMYYPKSGRKMMEFSPDGYIYRYYDNDENSEAWNIGLGGDISKATTDAWQEVYLCLLPLGTQTVVTSSSEFIPTKYWQFRSGSGNAWATYNKMYFTTDNPKNPKTLYDNGYTLPNGLYTPDKYPQQMIMDIEYPTRYYIRAWRIIDGKKTEDLIIMQQI